MIAARHVFTGPGARTGFQDTSANSILDDIWAEPGARFQSSSCDGLMLAPVMTTATRSPGAGL